MTNKPTALLVVDAQKTFMPGGELPVPNGDDIVAPLVKLLRERGRDFGLIVFSRDWHPENHFSFDENPRYEDGSWPVHGVADTENAQVHPDLIATVEELGLPYIVISKGMQADIEAYSAFDGVNLDTGRTLHEELAAAGIENVVYAGLAGEVCVRATVLAGLGLGYRAMLKADAIGFLGDEAPATEEMLGAGAVLDRLPIAGVA